MTPLNAGLTSEAGGQKSEESDYWIFILNIVFTNYSAASDFWLRYSDFRPLKKLSLKILKILLLLTLKHITT